MISSEIRNYITGTVTRDDVLPWAEKTLSKYLEKTPMKQGEIEHIIDFLNSDKAPKRISRMSVDEAIAGAAKWVKALAKKGKDIKEKEGDTKVVLDFKDGFKFVQLIGKAAYQREGSLMGHCVASYFGKDDEIYSLRDKKNIPHCTVSKDSQQIKGRGNGSIHPRYIGYVVQFLEHMGMEVRDSEMKNLGYANITPLLDDLHDDTKKELFRDRYFPLSQREKLKDKEGNAPCHIGMLDYFPLLEDTSTSVRLAWDIPALVSGSIEWIRKRVRFGASKDERAKAGGNCSKLADGDSSMLAGGNCSKLAGGNCSKLAGGNSSMLAGGDSSMLAGGNCSKLAGGYSSMLAGGNCSKLAGGDSSMLAGGNCSKLAGGYSSMLAGGDSSMLAGGNCSKLAGGDSSMLAGGYSSMLDIGERGIAVGDHMSQAKGKKNSVLVLIERNSDGSVKCVEAHAVDGKKVKEDVWYCIKDGKFQPVTNA